MQETERRRGGLTVDGHLVQAGEIVMVHDGSRLVGVVGSGVVVCVWESTTGLAAMAHFVKPRVIDSRKATARYGNAALQHLISMIEEHRTSSFKPEAQVFGGAHRPTEMGPDSLGHLNVEMARKVLASKGIPIVSEDVGGVKGRKLLFDTSTGIVVVVKVHDLREEDWSP